MDRYRAERALTAAKQDAETLAQVAHAAMLSANSANQAKSEFLAIMSHELRTPLKFRQILINLLTNAVKFTLAGGKVGLEAFVDEGGGLTVKVFDTGIAAEDIGKAMAPFLQVDGTLGACTTAPASACP